MQTQMPTCKNSAIKLDPKASDLFNPAIPLFSQCLKPNNPSEFDLANMISFKDPTMASTLASIERCCSFQLRDDGESWIMSPKGSEETVHVTTKKRISCDEPNCELVGFESLPDYQKDNEFILNHYRSEWPLKQTVLSIFSIHNETLNVWTHLIGFFVFLALTVCTVNMIPFYAPVASTDHQMIQPQETGIFNLPSLSILNIHQVTRKLNFSLAGQDDMIVMISSNDDEETVTATVTRWPFFAFMMGAMFCLLTSSACHLLSCHSEHCAYTMLRLDYTGISTLIVTSVYPLVYYTFMCDPFFCNLYIGFITVLGVTTVIVSLVPIFQTPEFRTVRALLFSCLAISGLVPIFHKMIAFGDRPEAVISTGYEMLMGLFYVVGVIVYATRVPERWFPGKFDLLGHSHQLFHVLVIAGAYANYLAGLMYLQWRDAEGC